MKLLKALTVCLILPFAFVACDKKEDNEASDGGPSKKADTHESITTEYFGYMEEVMGAMASLDSKEAALAFVAKAKEMQPKLEGLLERAKALPAPSDEQKAAIQATHKEIETKMMKKMMANVANPPSPEAATAIAEAMGSVMTGEFSEKMDVITDGIGAIYGIEK